MQNILILGAGLSTTSLIRYLLKQSEIHQWKVRVGDVNFNLAEKQVGGHINGFPFSFNILNDQEREEAIKLADIVISMLPVRFHHLVAKECIRFRKNMVTASYMSDYIKALEEDALNIGILILNEMGVDPGIDHMSAMRIINNIKSKGGHIHVFDSSTGGLVAPGYENNPWAYKFTWNPRNVVLAGKDGARFYHNKLYKHIPYHKLFQRTEKVNIAGLGEFEVYANRNSLQYQTPYGLSDIDTMFRGTIRRPGFCSSWDVLVQLGVTDDTFLVENSENLTYREFINCFLAYNQDDPVEKKVADYLGISEDSEMMGKLKWLGLFEKRKIALPEATPARILQQLLEEKWKLEKDDKDMVLMHHIFEYTLEEQRYQTRSSMVAIGHDKKETAMARTVGLPVAIAVKNILLGNIKTKGIQIPVIEEVYQPVLTELEELGISFQEDTNKISNKKTIF